MYVANMKHKTVSIITVTQWKRRECLMILADILKGQTYKSIVQWVIVEGSNTLEDATQNKAHVLTTVQLMVPFPIDYVPFTGSTKIGFLRNQGNTVCKGDIIVCMDDDDFYFPTRVEHAVQQLQPTRKKLAGCSALILYDWNLDRLYKFKGFAPNHSTNACMAWKNDFKNKHDNDKENAEEASFTNNFTVPMVQLDAFHVMVVNSHSQNTFNKRELLIGATLGINHTCEELVGYTAQSLMGEYYDRYKGLFFHETTGCPYDIIYYAGGFGRVLDLDHHRLSGPEQSLVQLSEHWVKTGKTVAVYAQILQHRQQNGVDYFDWKEFDFQAMYNTVILWRTHGFISGAPFHIKAQCMIADLQDAYIPPQFEGKWVKTYDPLINLYVFKTTFHAGYFQYQTKISLTPERYRILPNGVLPIAPSNSILRQPFRFCYTTCYTKGLSKMIGFLWTHLYKALPEAELHVYYGMDHVSNEKFKNTMGVLLSLPGVVDHGWQPRDAVMKEKQQSTFYLFPTDFPNDADSINIKECYATGCIPILSDYLLYKDMPGLHFPLGKAEQKDFVMIADKIIAIAKDPIEVSRLRDELQKTSVPDWSVASKAWMPLFQQKRS